MAAIPFPSFVVPYQKEPIRENKNAPLTLISGSCDKSLKMNLIFRSICLLCVASVTDSFCNLVYRMMGRNIPKLTATKTSPIMNPRIQPKYEG
jgi:hypothetical protein